MDVELTFSELRLAAEVGMQRHTANLKVGTSNSYGLRPSDDGWGVNIVGACGEMAVAKLLGIYWNGAFGNWKADDVGEYQVRTSKRDDADLRLHKNDSDDRIFILVIGIARVFRVVGWLKAVDGKLPEYWRDGAKGRPAYWVPQNRLHTMDELIKRRSAVN